MQVCFRHEPTPRAGILTPSLLGAALFSVLAATSADAQQPGARKNAASARPAAVAPAAPQPSESVQRFLGVFRLPDGGVFEARADAAGTGITLLGIEAASSVLLGSGKPSTEAELETLKAAEARVQKALAPLASMRGEVDGAQFQGPEAQASVQRSIDAMRPQFGAAAHVVYAGSDLAARTTWAYLRGAAGSVCVTVQWSASGRVSAVVASKTEPPTRVPFAVSRRDWAIGSVGKRPTTISVEGKGAGRVLVIEHAGALLVCPWKGDLR